MECAASTIVEITSCRHTLNEVCIHSLQRLSASCKHGNAASVYLCWRRLLDTSLVTRLTCDMSATYCVGPACSSVCIRAACSRGSFSTGSAGELCRVKSSQAQGELGSCGCGEVLASFRLSSTCQQKLPTYLGNLGTSLCCFPRGDRAMARVHCKSCSHRHFATRIRDRVRP